MRRLLLSVLLLSTFFLCRAQKADSLQYAKFDSLLFCFHTALEMEDFDSKSFQMDQLVQSCQDSLLRQHVALEIYRYYKDSKLMGDEAVAIHIYDRWFADGTVEMEGEYEKIDARMFADFNRQSLIGQTAPRIALTNPRGARDSIPSIGRTSVIFFFDTSCGKCRLNAKLLPSVFKTLEFDVDFYAIYCGQDKKEWRKFRREFNAGSRHVRTIHLWDPEFESDYIRAYGVIGTPKLFLVEPGGVIIGRRLEIDNLQELLPIASSIQAIYEEFSE